jgi:hypothetical protein
MWHFLVEETTWRLRVDMHLKENRGRAKRPAHGRPLALNCLRGYVVALGTTVITVAGTVLDVPV